MRIERFKKIILISILILTFLLVTGILFLVLSEDANYQPPIHPVCGNGICEFGEDEFNCPKDCKEKPQQYCGDGTCGYGESCHNCPKDCGVCPVVCSDECSYGKKRCSGNYVQTCGNYDSDDCLEWGGGIYCSDGCKIIDGRPQCIIHDIILSSINSNYATPKAYMEFEKQHDWYYKNELRVYVENNGNVEETIYIKCDYSDTITLDLNPRYEDYVNIEWMPPIDRNSVTISCRAYTSYGESTKSKYFGITKSDWVQYENNLPSYSDYYLRCTKDMNYCDSSGLMSKAESLRLYSPSDTVNNIRQWVYDNIDYDFPPLSDYERPATITYNNRYGVCCHKSMLYGAMTRYLNIPTKGLEGCVFAKCEWWEITCHISSYIDKILDEGPNHAWVSVWKGYWGEIDPTMNFNGRSSDIDYRYVEECDDNDNYDCYWGESCYR